MAEIDQPGKHPHIEGGLNREGQVSVEAKTQSFIEEIKGQQLPRTHSAAAEARVSRSIDVFVKPHILECLTVAAQIDTDDFLAVPNEVSEYTGEIGVTVCSEDRIITMGIILPRAGDIQRRAGAYPAVRKRTIDGRQVLADPDVEAGIGRTILRKRREGKSISFTQFIGCHVRTDKPKSGCGAITSEIRQSGRTVALGIEPDGGVSQYFKKLGDGFNAFDNTIRSLGETKFSTVDMVHDATTQGLIFGLRQVHQNFDADKTLEQNLAAFVDARQILMTSLLIPRFHADIIRIANSLQRRHTINLRDYKNFGPNMKLIGQTALELAQQEEKNHFPWLPHSIKNNLDDQSQRAVGYTAMHNLAYMVLANIGNRNTELEHRAMIRRIGPVGAIFNYESLALAQNTISGTLQESDLQRLDVLESVGDETYTHHGIDRKDYASVIITTQRDDTNRQTEEGDIADRIGLRNSLNAEHVRERYAESIGTGEKVVIAMKHRPGAKAITSVQP